MAKPKPILIAIDGSPSSVQATSVGLDLAVAQGAGVVFVHCSPIAGPLFDEAGGGAVSHQVIEDADPVLAAAAEAARTRGVDFELEIVDERGETDIASAIAGIGAGRDAALVVVGTRGRGMIAGAVLGSVSHGLLGLSKVPVVVAHAVTRDLE